jgi:uncharacterized protein
MPLHHVVVTGSHGRIGTALCAALTADGSQITRLVRSSPGPQDAVWDIAAGTIDAAKLEGADAVVHLAGEGIADAKWTAEQKRKVLDSRTQGTALLAKTVAALTKKPTVFASGSAIGFYGDRGDEVLDETSKPGTGFLAEVCTAWEASASAAAEAGIRTVFLRTGVVQSTTGGALQKQLLPFKLGIGGRLGSGKQYVPWITLQDEVAAIRHVLATASLRGPVNLTAPNPVTNADYTKALGKAVHRPTLLPIPLLALKVRFGDELVREALLSSARVVPKALLGSGFQFAHPELGEALGYLLKNHV